MQNLKHKDRRQTLNPLKVRLWCCREVAIYVQNNKSNRNQQEKEDEKVKYHLSVPASFLPNWVTGHSKSAWS